MAVPKYDELMKPFGIMSSVAMRPRAWSPKALWNLA